MARKGGTPENLKNFKKGVDPRRNLKGRPPVLPDLKEAIAKILSEKTGDITALDAILAALKAKAAKGDVRAAQELLDRGFGKSQQFIDIKSGGNKLTPPTFVFKKLNESGGDKLQPPIIDYSKLSIETLRELANAEIETK